MKPITRNLLIAAIVFTFLFFLFIYARQIKIAFVFLLVGALLWITFVEETRLEACQAKCGK
jgi:Flp pilus assembly protein TadB